jgi:hypothetical protein
MLLLALRALQAAELSPLRARQPASGGALLQQLQALLVGLNCELLLLLAPLRALESAQFAPPGAVKPPTPGLLVQLLQALLNVLLLDIQALRAACGRAAPGC